jgi:ribonuclease-3
MRVRFRDPALLELALTHTSFAAEQDRPRGSALVTNQRLEFLGDAVLALVVADLAFRTYEDLPEGELARLRSATVNQTVLAQVARDLGVGEHLRLGRGEVLSGGRDKDNILADAMEALLGAVYLDRGLEAAFHMIQRLFRPSIRAYVRGEGARDYKGMLQELTADQGLGVPRYRVEGSGPPHRPEFAAQVRVAGALVGSGLGRTNKHPSPPAARVAFGRLRAGADAEGVGTGREDR